MARKGTGILIMWAEIPAELEDELRRWYDQERLAEVMAVPGVMNAARYEATSSGPKHLVVYELESPAVVQSEAWTSRPRTEWFKRIAPSVIGSVYISNVYEMIHPAELTDEIANSDMAPALQSDGWTCPRKTTGSGTTGTRACTFRTTKRCPGASGGGVGGL
jgi:hypothetical protein